MEFALLTVGRDGPIARVSLSRPDVRNAFNARLIAELHACFDALAADAAVRVAVLSGTGRAFCGGADVTWMRASLDLSVEENREDARAMSRMFRALDRFPKPLVGRVHGAAVGGGVGLAAVCDVVVAAEGTVFALSETRLGILPAVIAPFVLAKVGASHLRALGLTGQRFDAARAHAIGLVHEVVATEADLDAAVDAIAREALGASPSGIAAAKALFARVAGSDDDGATLELTARAIAAQRTSPEGQDGLRAFLEKRPPAWAR